jgi:VIT family
MKQPHSQSESLRLGSKHRLPWLPRNIMRIYSVFLIAIGINCAITDDVSALQSEYGDGSLHYTTFAIVAGVAGANLSASVLIILGLANLIADGFAMAASNYTGTKSEHDDYDRILRSNANTSPSSRKASERKLDRSLLRRDFRATISSGWSLSLHPMPLKHTRQAIHDRLAQGPRNNYLREWIYGGIDGTVTCTAMPCSISEERPLPRHNRVADDYCTTRCNQRFNYCQYRGESPDRCARKLIICRRDC